MFHRVFQPYFYLMWANLIPIYNIIFKGVNFGLIDKHFLESVDILSTEFNENRVWPEFFGTNPVKNLP